MVAGALGGLVLGYREYVNKPIIDKRVLDQVSDSNNCLTISQGYYPKPVSDEYTRMSADGSLYIGNYNQDYSIMSQVSLKPGPDGNLYIRVNDEWKQVLTS